MGTIKTVNGTNGDNRMVKTKEELEQLSDDELLAFNNALVEINLQTDSADVMLENYAQMDLFKEVWRSRHGVEDQVFEKTVPRPRG